jgi:hypothetical protein
MLIAVSIAVFVVIFTLVASRSLISQSLYQNRVISEKKKTLKVAKDNQVAAKNLEQSYVAFADEQPNVIGGNKDGSGPKDGDNAKLILDSLPSVLDFPALSSSIEKILIDGGYTIETIGGDEIAESLSDETGGEVASSVKPVPTEVDYPIFVTTSPEATLSLLRTLENSIRPFKLTTLELEGSGNNIGLKINMKTFYQSSTGVQVSSKEVK